MKKYLSKIKKHNKTIIYFNIWIVITLILYYLTMPDEMGLPLCSLMAYTTIQPLLFKRK